VRDLERHRQHAHHGAPREVAAAPRFEQRQRRLGRQRRQRGAMPHPGPRVERQQHAAIAARHRRRRQRQELIELVDGARAGAGEEAPLGQRRSGDREQGSPFARAE